MIKRRIVRFLIKLLEPSIHYRDIDDTKIESWLADTAKDIRFHEYFRKRDLTLLKALGVGLDREQYVMKVGQRLELLQLLGSVNEAKKSKDRQVALRQREADRLKQQANQEKR